MKEKSSHQFKHKCCYWCAIGGNELVCLGYFFISLEISDLIEYLYRFTLNIWNIFMLFFCSYHRNEQESINEPALGAHSMLWVLRTCIFPFKWPPNGSVYSVVLILTLPIDMNAVAVHAKPYTHQSARN